MEQTSAPPQTAQAPAEHRVFQHPRLIATVDLLGQKPGSAPLSANVQNRISLCAQYRPGPRIRYASWGKDQGSGLPVCSVSSSRQHHVVRTTDGAVVDEQL